MAEAIHAPSRVCGDNCVCERVADCIDSISGSALEAFVLRWLGPPSMVIAAGIVLATGFSWVAVLASWTGVFK